MVERYAKGRWIKATYIELTTSKKSKNYKLKTNVRYINNNYSTDSLENGDSNINSIATYKSGSLTLNLILTE